MIAAGNKIRGLAELVSDEPLVDVEPDGSPSTAPPHAHACGS